MTTIKDERDGTGTREWTDYSYNICRGCAHDCGYCYARPAALWRGQVASCADWANQVVLERKVVKAARDFKGSVMFPTTHDITPQILPQALQTLNNLLTAGNRVLLVSKAHLEVVKRICADFVAHRARLEFRITVGSGNAATCALWEPGAPPPEERIAALRHAHEKGFKTSVSMEPMLEPNEAMCSLLARVEPFVSGTIWLGKLNGGVLKVIQAKAGVRDSLLRIRAGQSDEHILRLHDRLAEHPKVCWKDSIKEVLRRHGRLPQPSQLVSSPPDPALAARRSAAARKACQTIRERRAAGSTSPAPKPAPDSAAEPGPVAPEATTTPLTPAKKAWVTIRRRYTPEQIWARAQAAAQKGSIQSAIQSGLAPVADGRHAPSIIS